MSLAILLLMSLALVGGETGGGHQGNSAAAPTKSATLLALHFHRGFDLQLGQRALSLGIGIATDLSPFRGEDE